MNYISQLNWFYESLQTNSLTANSICLYGLLLHMNNRCGWTRQFTVANLTLQGMSNLSRVQIDRARNELCLKGYLEYQKGRGNQAGKYLLVSCDTQRDTQQYTQQYTQQDTQQDTQMLHSCSTLTKLNYKLNNTIVNATDVRERECVFAAYEKNIGTLSATVTERLLSYALPDNVICFAIELAALNNARNLRYVEKILLNWEQKGIKTLDAAKLENKSRKTNTSSSRHSRSVNYTQNGQYDIDALERLATMPTDSKP